MIEKYESFALDGVTIWYPRDLIIGQDGCTIGLEKHWIFKELVVLGVESQVLGG